MKKITDEAVRELPLHEGRVDLLEEIMSTTPTDRPLESPDASADLPPRPRRWPVTLAAAAAVAAAIAVPVVLAQGGDERGQVTGQPSEPPSAPDFGSGDRAILTAGGWTVEYSTDHPQHGGELSYANGAQRLDVHWRPASAYDGYVEDRQHIAHPEVDPGTPVEVLGKPSLLWPYSADDHTVIRPVEEHFFLEVRGGGMDRATFVDLLGDLRLVSREEFQASLPENSITDEERAAEVRAMLVGLPVPDGFEVPASSETERYHLAADVTGAVACHWIAQFDQAQRNGDRAAARAAQQAMGTASTWPVLVEIKDEGGWSDVVWEYADQVVAGRVPEGYRQGIGCDD